MCNFRVGQKVVCVAGQAMSELTSSGWAPKTGAVYTVRSVLEWEGRSFLRLEEYVEPRTDKRWGEGGWDAARFSPIEGTNSSATPETVGAA